MFHSRSTALRCVILAAVLAAFVCPAAAQVDRSKAAAAKSAADNFVKLSQGSEKSGNAPRATDAAAKPLIDATFDSRDVEGAKAVTFQDISGLSERMMNGVKVGVVYMLAGTGVTDLSQLGGVDDAAVKVNLNVIKFAPEMGRFFDFQMRMQGAIIDAVLDRMATAKPDDLNKPNFKSGLADIRQGSQRATAGVIETLAVNGIEAQWIRDRIPALTAIAPKLGKFLEPQQRAELQQLANACADVMDDAQVKASLQAFAKTVAGS
jgi:hypothetical protein